MERRLAAILAADVVGYTRLMGADEAGTLKRLTALREDVLAPLIAQHRGRIVKLMGDGLLVEFPSVVDSVTCALAWQQDVAAGEAAREEAKRLCFRIGINLGDILVEGEDIHGDGVNIAARLEALAEPGGICLSDDAYRQAKGRLEAGFEDLGEKTLKNVAEAVRVYRVLGEATLPSNGPDAALDAENQKPSIAVLPFTNMSNDPEQEYFSDGITEDIITELSRFPTLFVIARNSSFSYKGKALDLRQVAEDLGVRYLLEGSIRRAGQRVRVTAQLIEKGNANHIWAERYDRDLDDIFALQEELTSNVVGAIAPQIEMAEMARLHTGRVGSDRGDRPVKFSAYDLALKAQTVFYDAVRKGSPEMHQESLKLAAAALEQDPRCMLALWVQGWASVEQYVYRWGPDPKKALDLAEQTVERLMEIDASDPRSHTTRAFLYHFRGEHDAAVADYRRAFALNPNWAVNVFCMAWCESLCGLTEEAREHAALGLRLSPRENEVWLGVAYLALAQASFAEGDYEKTKHWAELAVQMHPRAPIRRTLMIACCVEIGDLQKAQEHAAFLRSFAPNFIPSLFEGEMKLYKDPAHDRRLAEGLRKAGLG